jgi:hypothetical protein
MANQITVFLDPTLLPSRTQDQPTFDVAMSYLVSNFPVFGAQFNAGVASFNAAAAGTAYAIPYTLSSSTVDGDPTAGLIRLVGSGSQSATTVIDADLLAVGGADYTTILDTFDDSTSTIKGTIRLVKAGDPSKFLVFSVTGMSSPAGYRSISVAGIGGSAASPFVGGDLLLLFFQRTGDAGPPGTILRRSATATSTATLTPNATTTDISILTAQAVNLTLGAPTGSPLDGQGLMFRIKDNGTARTLAYATAYRASSDLPFPTTTVAGKTMYLGFIYNAADGKWDLVAAISNVV